MILFVREKEEEMLRTILLLSLWGLGVFVPIGLKAESHNNLWLRGTLTYIPAEKFRVETEFQHRRQNGIGNKNLFDETLLYSYRNWIRYRHNKTVHFSVSPFAYFANYRVIRKSTDIGADPRREIRFSAAIDLQHEILKNFYISNRNFVEYRLFTQGEQDIVRYRNRIGFRYDIGKKIKLNIYDEILLNVTGVTKEHLFDHNRAGIQFEYSILPNFKMDIGYMHIARLPLNNMDMLTENNFVFNFTYEIFKPKKGSKTSGT